MAVKLPGPADWLFAVRTYAAAMVALYIAFALGFDRPYWAMASAYIASQPLSGATRSKAVYRASGTVLGAAAAVALVPTLVDAPILLSLAMATWTGICLYFALLDRTPRSYVFMLAGYTAAIIGFPSVDAPDQIFTTAVSRVQEICLGIGCASAMASVLLPRRVAPVLLARLEAWLRNARESTVKALRGEPDDETVRAVRQRLAGDLAEVDLLTSYLAWDPAAQPDAVRTLRALRRRMLMLLPIVSSLADRVRAEGQSGAVPERVQRLLAGAETWVAGSEGAPALDDLRQELARAEGAAADASDWPGLIRASLLERLRQVLDLLEDCRRLRGHIETGGPFPAALAFHRTAGPAEIRHRDHGRALWSGASAGLAVLICCAYWIGSGWAEGAVAAEMTAVACCFFATLDDPVPAILRFLAWSVVAVVVDAVYLFAVLPGASDFPVLALALAPVYIGYALLTPRPSTSSIGMALTANGSTLLSLQSTYSAQFDAFANSALAFVVGLGMAAVVTRIVRSVGAEWSAWQLLRRNWIDLARAAERRGQGDRAQFAGLMLDRIGLLAPRIAASAPGTHLAAVDSFADLRVGLNIVALRRARRGLAEPARRAVDAMLDGLARHYRSRARQVLEPVATELLSLVDHALAAVMEAARPAAARVAMLGLVGIRRGLFPEAPPFRAAPPPETSLREAA